MTVGVIHFWLYISLVPAAIYEWIHTNSCSLLWQFVSGYVLRVFNYYSFLLLTLRRNPMIISMLIATTHTAIIAVPTMIMHHYQHHNHIQHIIITTPLTLIHLTGKMTPTPHQQQYGSLKKGWVTARTESLPHRQQHYNGVPCVLRTVTTKVKV